MKAVVIVGALDTKGRELAFVKDLVEQQGLAALVVDFGILGEPTIPADVSREEVARAGGGDLEYLRRNQLREEAMPIMAEGLAVVVRRLYDEGRLDAILGMGGGGGTSIATTGMRALPFGVPKVMVSTVAGGNVRAFVGPKDIIMMPSIVDVAGINRISARVYANAVGAIAGMLGVEPPASEQDKPLITASMFGNTTACVDRDPHHPRSVPGPCRLSAARQPQARRRPAPARTFDQQFTYRRAHRPRLRGAGVPCHRHRRTDQRWTGRESGTPGDAGRSWAPPGPRRTHPEVVLFPERPADGRWGAGSRLVFVPGSAILANLRRGLPAAGYCRVVTSDLRHDDAQTLRCQSLLSD